MREFKENDLVKHFKIETLGEDAPENMYVYKIVAVATHTETKEKMVIYQAMYTHGDIKAGQTFARPYDMFMSEVDHEKYPNIKQKYRFELYN